MKLTLFVFCSLVALTRADLAASPVDQEISNFQGRTLGGTATVGQLPWHVWVRSAVGTSSITCGGTLIAGNWVLTAAHCVHGYNTFTIEAGSNNINAPVIQMISTIAIVNPSFDATTYNNNVALIQLPTSVNSYHDLAPVRLPARSQAATTFVNAVGTVSGLRRLNNFTTALSSFLSVVNMSVMTNAACVNVHGSAVVTDNVLCASATPVQPTIFGACLGDSGGPMVIYENNVPTLIGVISFFSGSGCGAGNPTGFARVSRFLTWINGVTGIPLR